MKQDNSDVGARDRNKTKQTIKQNKRETKCLTARVQYLTTQRWARKLHYRAIRKDSWKVCLKETNLLPLAVDDRMAKIVYFHNYHDKYMRKV